MIEINKKRIKIISIVAVVLIIVIVTGFSLSKNKSPKNVDVGLYKEAIKLMAFYERAEDSGLEVKADGFINFSDYAKKLIDKRELTKEEREIINTVQDAGLAYAKLKELNNQDYLDEYTKNKSKIKKLLNIPDSKKFNSIKIE